MCLLDHCICRDPARGPNPRLKEKQARSLSLCPHCLSMGGEGSVGSRERILRGGGCVFVYMYVCVCVSNCLHWCRRSIEVGSGHTARAVAAVLRATTGLPLVCVCDAICPDSKLCSCGTSLSALPRWERIASDGTNKKKKKPKRRVAVCW